jgi:O-antigen biosynthesis protein
MLETPADRLRSIPDLPGAMQFRSPSRVGVESAWYGHVPFGYWLTCQARPRLLVELGTHNGVSYSAFCDAVLDMRLASRCFAVDTWQGDPNAGFYGEEVFLNFREFHDRRYSTFSTMLRMTFDEALGQLPDGSVDLLHFDGEHTYEAVRHDFESWLPKLSDQAIVLFHDTNVRERNFGVWRLWHELRQTYPGFEFIHASGLGVLAVGQQVPLDVAGLCSITCDDTIATIRRSFARIGEWCESASRLLLLQAQVARLTDDQRRWEAELTDRAASAERAAGDARRELAAARSAWLDAERELGENRRELADGRRRLDDMNRRIADMGEQLAAANLAAAGEIDRWQHTVAALTTERDIIVSSTLWRMTAPIRRAALATPTPVRRILQRLSRTIYRPPRAKVAAAPGSPADTMPIDAAGPIEAAGRSEGGVTALPATSYRGEASDGLPRDDVLIISGEPAIPGHSFRVVRHARALATLRLGASWMALAEAPMQRARIARASVVVLWRAANCTEVAEAIAAARGGGAKVVFDVDDLMFKPELAFATIIDGIRTQGLTEADVADNYRCIKEVIVQADACSCTTEELARHLREMDKITFVVPNCFDAAVLNASRLAVRRRPLDDDGIIRLGYAAGRRTHQRDFGCAAEALGRILRERPECRLVLFRAPGGGLPLLDPGKFHDLADLHDRIEWRDLVPLTELPGELARFDINLAPLEVGNPFCEAKSELKYVEAALVEVCTVASPAGALRRAIRDGVTGRLADTPDAWHDALRTLIDDRQLRRRLAHAAYLDVLARFGPERSAESLSSMLRQLSGGPDAARQFELDLLRQRMPWTPTFDIAECDIAFASDAQQVAEITVVIPLYNYEDFIEEALDSVRNQSLRPLDLVVIDDASTDRSSQVALAWIRCHADRFNRVLLLRNRANAGLARSRNIGFDHAETSYILPLDADNRLLPDCCDRLLGVLRDSNAGFAYSRVRCFGGSDHVISTEPFSAMRFASSNYIDAMALVAKSAWARIGGYRHIQYGWEDYDFWCRCVEHGLWGIHVPEMLAEYRFHEKSMLRTTTDTPQNTLRIIQQLEDSHPWLTLSAR